MGSRYNQAYLIREEYTADEIGQQIATETKTKVFCEISSIYGSEFWSAAQNGFEPDCKIVIWEAEYNGERIIELCGRRLTVYKHFIRTDGRIELYTKGRIGNE